MTSKVAESHPRTTSAGATVYGVGLGLIVGVGVGVGLGLGVGLGVGRGRVVVGGGGTRSGSTTWPRLGTRSKHTRPQRRCVMRVCTYQR